MRSELLRDFFGVPNKICLFSDIPDNWNSLDHANHMQIASNVTVETSSNVEISNGQMGSILMEESNGLANWSSVLASSRSTSDQEMVFSTVNDALKSIHQVLTKYAMKREQLLVIIFNLSRSMANISASQVYAADYVINQISEMAKHYILPILQQKSGNSASRGATTGTSIHLNDSDDKATMHEILQNISASVAYMTSPLWAPKSDVESILACIQSSLEIVIEIIDGCKIEQEVLRQMLYHLTVTSKDISDWVRHDVQL